MSQLIPRATPCASCPYRRDVPSGVWDRSEYEKLRGYDGDISQQVAAGAFGVFHCHQGDGKVCAGWAGCHDMHNTLAVRLAVAGRENVSALTAYQSPVPLFSSGNEAADHGERETGHPDEKAIATISKVIRVRQLRGQPVRFGDRTARQQPEKKS